MEIHTTPSAPVKHASPPRSTVKHKPVRALLGTLALVAVAAFAAPNAASAAENGADFSGYCKATYGRPGVSVSAWHAWAGSWTAVTWRCRETALWPIAPTGNFASIFKPVRGITYSLDHEIDVNALCRWQHGGGSSATLKGQSWSDWRCNT